MKTTYFMFFGILLALVTSCHKEELQDYSQKNTLEDNAVKGRSFFPTSTALNFTLESRNHSMGGFAAQETTLFKDNIWLVGGDNSHTPNWSSSSQVWKSPNGRDWKLITSGLFEKRHNHSLIVFKNKMWLIGGINNSQEILSDIWNTSDGVHWNRVKPLKPFNDIGQNNSVVFNNRLFVFKANGSVNQEVWSSADGLLWKLETDNAFPSRTHYKTVVHNSMIYAIGGWLIEGLTNEVWGSEDGINWEIKLPSTVIFDPRLSHTVTSYKGKVWVIGGESWNAAGTRTFYGDIWYSSNMEKWHRYDGKPPFYKGLEAPSSLVYKDKLWVFGGYRPDGSMASILSSSIYSIE